MSEALRSCWLGAGTTNSHGKTSRDRQWCAIAACNRLRHKKRPTRSYKPRNQTTCAKHHDMRFVTGVLLVGAAALLPHHVSRPKCIRRASTEDAADANDADDDEATLFSKRKAAEIKIPVEVYDTTPPQNLVGVYPLSPTVGCGDILRVEKEEIEAYVIKRVESRKRWMDGNFVLDSMRADATEVNRASLEKRLRRMMPE